MISYQPSYQPTLAHYIDYTIKGRCHILCLLCFCVPFSHSFVVLFLFSFFQSGSVRVRQRGGETRWKKSEAGLYLVMSKTVLICSETLQENKVKKIYGGGGEVQKRPTLKKRQNLRPFYSPLSDYLSVCLPLYRSLDLSKGVNEDKTAGSRQRNAAAGHLGDIIQLLLSY
jgi:hypothetical protein